MADAGTIKSLVFLALIYGALRLGRRGALLPEIDAAVGRLLRPRMPAPHGESGRALVVFAVLAALFAGLLSKFGGGLVMKWPVDQLWHQAMVDYDALWRTPWFSIPGNVLYQFDLRSPVTTHLMPALGISELFPAPWRVTVSYAALFIEAALLFWLIGATFGLRPVQRAAFAGVVGIIVVIPVGFDKIVFIAPVNFFTTQSLLATWWGEAPLLMLATILAFFWIGGFATAAWNGVAALGFTLGTWLAVLAYPAGAVFFVPIIAVYAAVFVVTAPTRREIIWKLAVGGAVALLMLALNVPRFFINLYGYTFGSVFFEQVRAPTAGLIADTFMIGARGFDARAIFVYVVAMVTALVLARQGRGAPRRFALGILSCEAAIVLASSVNAFTVRAPLLFAYAEVAHAPLWGALAVLVALAVATLIDRRIGALAQSDIAWRRAARTHRQWFYALTLVAGVLLFVLFSPPPAVLDYPPQPPAALDNLRRDLALTPGAPFRGRVATIYARDGNAPFEAKAFANRAAFGSDFYSDLLPLGIPSLNQSQTWTSPVTFALLYRFFANPDDAFDKNFFWLDRFDGRIARMLGVRAVVSDTAIAGMTPVETLARDGRTLRIYRLDGVNLGQYSPTQAVRFGKAQDVFAFMASPGFDPQHDVAVEEELPGGLVRAQSVSATVEFGPVLRVRATSTGRSLLVLPFEFSRCLRQMNASGARLLPVNLQQLGLLFDRRADVAIDYRYGVFDSACRGEDLARAATLDLNTIMNTPGP